MSDFLQDPRVQADAGGTVNRRMPEPTDPPKKITDRSS